MLAVVKKPHTNMMLFEVKGDIPKQVLGYLQQQFGQNIEIIEDEEESVNIFESNWYKQISATLTPGDAMKVYRENHSFTLAELSKKLGDLTTEEISEMERNERRINLDVAKKLSHLFELPIERFL
jgi:DNA-binding XRE family transcriptional regulator